MLPAYNSNHPFFLPAALLYFLGFWAQNTKIGHFRGGGFALGFGEGGHRKR
jgi:hypothetical protein